MEREVNLTCVIATIMWAGTFILIFAGSMVGLLTRWECAALAVALMAHGLALSAAAATMSIRAMLRKQNHLLRDAFKMGEEAAGVRKLGK